MSAFQSANPDFDSDIRRRFAASPVCGFFGFEVVETAPGGITLALAIRSEFGHAPGFFQGAILGAMADYAGSYAAYTLIPDTWTRITLDYTLKFLAPARGERLIGRGRVVTAGRTLSTSVANLYVVNEGLETLCAIALVGVRHLPRTGQREQQNCSAGATR